MFLKEDLLNAKTRDDLIKIGKQKSIKLNRVLNNLNYQTELNKLQEQLINLQYYIIKKKLRVAVIFEGRDAAGKGGMIKRFKEYLNPRYMRVVALNKPTEIEKGQWYFRRYIKELPNPGEIVFFDRSWYNRAVVEPVMGFCSKAQYDQFMIQVPGFEHMLYEDGIIVIKFWFSISKEEQNKRMESRQQNPLKKWKYSPVDKKGQELWAEYTKYKNRMFSQTHNNFSPWIIVKSDDKRTARLESIRFLLSKFQYPYKSKAKTILEPDPNIVSRYYRHIEQLDY